MNDNIQILSLKQVFLFFFFIVGLDLVKNLLNDYMTEENVCLRNENSNNNNILFNFREGYAVSFVEIH